MKKEIEMLRTLNNDRTDVGYETQEYAGALVKALSARDLHVSCAESCTAGMVAAAIGSVPGASKVMDRSFVTYSEEAKADLVGVSMSVIRTYGVVSPQVARQMADGAFRKAGGGVGIGITGYAGPSGDQVGRVCIGVRAAWKDDCGLEKDLYVGTDYTFTGDRNMVREKAAAAAIGLAVLALG